MSTKLNEIMRVLTIISVIFIPITFIVGVYGTNFTYLPEKDFRYGYFVMWGVMLIISLGMILYFKKKKWFWCDMREILLLVNQLFISFEQKWFTVVYIKMFSLVFL